MPRKKGDVPTQLGQGLTGHEKLQQVLQQFGGFTGEHPSGIPRETTKTHGRRNDSAKGGATRISASERFSAEASPRSRKRRPGSATRTVADMMRNWSAYRPEESPGAVSEPKRWATLEDGARAQGSEAVQVHKKVLSSLDSLQRLKNELELTFQAVVSLPPPRWGAEKREAGEGVALADSGVATVNDEISVQIEWQGSSRGSGFGKAQSILLRAPWAFEMMHKDSGTFSRAATPRLQAATPSTRPGTPRADVESPTLALMDVAASAGYLSPRSDAGEELSVPGNLGWLLGQRRPLSVQATGDNGHAISIPLRERVPETVVVRRLRSGKGRSSSGRDDCAPVLPPLCDAAEGPQAEAAGLSAGPAAWVASVEAECAHLERIFASALQNHSEETPSRGDDQENDVKSAEGPGRLESYLRDLRAVIRLIGPGIPSAARLLEGGIKGAVLALDAELSEIKSELQTRNAQIASMTEASSELEGLRTELATVQQAHEDLKKQFGGAEKTKQDEVRGYQEMIERFKEEINRLNPEEGSVQTVAGLMDQCSMLLDDIEETSKDQSKILSQMTSYTAHIVREAADDSSNKLKLHRPGRIIQKLDGEIELRPCDVVEMGTQVIDSDLLKIDSEAAVRFRTPEMRRLIASFQGRSLRKIKLEELGSEIDKIYVAKISADSEADVANRKRSELHTFGVEFYLEQLGTVTLAQERLCSMLDCIRQLEQNSAVEPVPLKVSLFARFLNFCDYDRALPLPVLSIALQAKRNLAALNRSNPGVGGKDNPASKVPVAPLSPRTSGKNWKSSVNSAAGLTEMPIAIGNAWDAGFKALPAGGSVAGKKELFVAMLRYAVIQTPSEEAHLRDFYFLIMILHDRLKKEAAPKMRDLVYRVEQRGTASVDDFRECLRDAGLIGVDESIWRSKFCPPDNLMLSEKGVLAESQIMEYFGGGAINRMPKGYVTESHLMASVAEAVTAEDRERTASLLKIARQLHGPKFDVAKSKLNFNDFRLVVSSADTSLSSADIRSMFLATVEVSRSCFQYEADACPMIGVLDPAPNGQYGGETVTLQLLELALMSSPVAFMERGKDGWAKAETHAPQGTPSSSQSHQKFTAKSPSGSKNIKKNIR